ncbi:S41 family peptidase [Sporosarcina sp.]|uniref:S41 family peptidase n=1 Tax=Sporosarcina sp. TaxID=49982 RepID=UPI00262A3CFF|nr:S41 family peptidase [Sporosarcina sp.]
MKNKLHALLFLSLALFLLPAPTFANPDVLKEVRQLITTDYVDSVPEDVLNKPEVSEILKELDPYTVYMTKNEFEQFMNGIEQRIVGIGVVLEEHELGVQILSVVPGAPAEQAGILAGDIITHANGDSLAGKSVQAAIPFISGPADTSVTLTLVRPSADTFKKVLKRQEIQLVNVESRMLGGNIGYIRLHSFSNDAALNIQKAIQQMPNADSWILDLRDNGGGYVGAAQQVMGLFPQMKQAFQLRSRDKTETFPVIKQPHQFQAPVALLVNGYSASASEMVAGSVKERKAATLFGQTTYGKGTMQTMYQLSDDSVLKMTIARFLTPGARTIDQVGVAPDVVTDEGEELQAAHKQQLINRLPGYKKLPALENVPVTKTFRVEMNMPMQSDLVKDAVQLIELGGKAQAITVERTNQSTITVKPVQSLKPGASYTLVIHPTWKNLQSKPLKQGVYVNVTVRN